MNNNPYVFISYAHLDSHTVLPCVDAMKRSGIDLWFDEGIEAGSEWPEFIAEKVMNCTKFVLFVSNAYLNSQNCKRELNFAISRKKDILSIYLEDVNLSPGMEMQLGTYQAIYKNRFADIPSFHTSLCGETYFNVCRTAEPTEAEAQVVTQPQALVQPQPQPGVQTSNFSNSVNSAVEDATATFKNVFGNAFAFSNGSTAMTTSKPKSRIVAALLAIFLGGLGVHKFYLKKPVWGIVYILFCTTYIPALVSLVEGIIWLCSTDEKFNAKYNNA